MSLSMGLINSKEQVFIRKFDDQNDQLISKRVELDDLEKENVDMLLIATDEAVAIKEDQAKFIPVRKATDFDLAEESFEKLEMDKAWSIYKNATSSWSLSNNISLLNELFPIAEHMKKLYPNERIAFFEELWFTLKRNLGSYELKVVYNDIIKAKKEGQKDQLIKSFVDGHSLPELNKGTELEDTLMQHYKAHFAENFEVCEFNSEKNQLVLTASINESPVLIMAKVTSFSPIQKALLKSYFDGLNS